MVDRCAAVGLLLMISGGLEVMGMLLMGIVLLLSGAGAWMLGA